MFGDLVSGKTSVDLYMISSIGAFQQPTERTTTNHITVLLETSLSGFCKESAFLGDQKHKIKSLTEIKKSINLSKLLFCCCVSQDMPYGCF